MGAAAIAAAKAVHYTNAGTIEFLLDAQDRFYFIDSGTVRVGLEYGEKQSGPGDYFGEIALLRDVPRTATVTAVSSARLYTLERADFLAAVTGHALAEAAAHEVVDARLAGTFP